MDTARYERQLLLPEVGETGQKKLLASSVLVVGCGGLGSTLLYDLCGMGIGRIGFCDGDIVSYGNLNRQFLHAVRDIAETKRSPRLKPSKRLRPTFSSNHLRRI